MYARDTVLIFNPKTYRILLFKQFPICWKGMFFICYSGALICLYQSFHVSNSFGLLSKPWYFFSNWYFHSENPVKEKKALDFYKIFSYNTAKQ